MHIIFRLVALILVVLACGRGPNSYAQVSIKIGANLPFSGELAFYGSEIKDGALLAVEDLSATSNPRAKLDSLWDDNQGDNKTTVSVLKNHLAKGVDLYVSALKPQTMTITKEVSKRGLPHFTWILDVKINDETTRNNIRTWISFGSEADAFLKFAEKRQVNRVAMLYTELLAAELEFKNILAPAFRKRGASEVWIESYPLDTSDFRTVALKVKQFNPDLIILNGFIHHLAPLIRALRVHKLIKTGDTLASLVLLDVNDLLTPAELEGVVVAAPSFLLQSNEEWKQWQKRFKDKFGRSPTYHAAYAYDMVNIINNAATRIKLPASAEQWLSALRQTNSKGITGPLRFNDDGSLITEMRAASFLEGKLVPGESN